MGGRPGSPHATHGSLSFYYMYLYLWRLFRGKERIGIKVNALRTSVGPKSTTHTTLCTLALPLWEPLPHPDFSAHTPLPPAELLDFERVVQALAPLDLHYPPWRVCTGIGINFYKLHMQVGNQIGHVFYSRAFLPTQRSQEQLFCNVWLLPSILISMEKNRRRRC
jgi:hypothetical protein